MSGRSVSRGDGPRASFPFVVETLTTTRGISYTEKFTLSYAIGVGGTGSSPETCSRLIRLLDGTGATPRSVPKLHSFGSVK